MVQEESGERTPTVLDLDGDTLDMLKVIEPGRGRGTPHRLADRPMDADLAAALMSAELEFTSNHSGGATVNLGRNLAAAVVGPTDRLADLFPDVPPTMTDRNQSVVIVSLPDCDAVATDVMVPDDQGDADIEQVRVIARLAEGVTVITGDGNNITVPAGTVMGPVYDGDDDRPAVAAMCETLTAALTAALPEARSVAVMRVETARRARENNALPDYIRADRDAERKQAEVAADRAARTGETTTTVTADGYALAAGEADVLADLTAPALLPVPTLGDLGPGRFALQRYRVSSVYGASGTGKSSWALWQALAVLKQDPNHRVLVIDAEDHWDLTRARLAAMAGWSPDLFTAPDGTRRFAYVRLSAGPVPESLTSQRWDMVLIDGVDNAMQAAGYPTVTNNTFTAWYRSVPRPLADNGAAVLLVDHVTMSGSTGVPAGAAHKVSDLDGALFYMRVVRPLVPGKGGEVSLSLPPDVLKDRAGYFRRAMRKDGFLATVEVVNGELPEDAPEGTMEPTTMVTQVYADMDAAGDSAPTGRSKRKAPAAVPPLDAWEAEHPDADLSRTEVLAIAVAAWKAQRGTDMQNRSAAKAVQRVSARAYNRGHNSERWGKNTAAAAEGEGFITRHPGRTTWTVNREALGEYATAALDAVLASL